ncbi:MAG: hypothetical protein CW338_08125 [Clostridiales bacterium]|nr:hypothetical protein [Clostridiales bacterium]
MKNDLHTADAHKGHEENSFKERLGKTIRKYRLNAGVGVKGLGEKLGVSAATVNYWEGGRFCPVPEMMARLCRMFDIPPAELLGLEENEGTMDEKNLLENYRQMSDLGKQLAFSAVNAMAEEERKNYERELKETYRPFLLHSTPAAAGTGYGFSDFPTQCTFARVNARNMRSDAIVRVSGRSMEPVYKDGDMVYLKYTQDISQGDDVVCSTQDGAVIKRMGKGKLYSINTDYPFGPKFEDDHVRVIGKVMGVVVPEDLAQEKDRHFLSEVYCYEVKQMLKRVRPES